MGYEGFGELDGTPNRGGQEMGLRLEMRSVGSWGVAAGLVLAVALASAFAQPRGRTAAPAEDPPPQGVARGENFSAKPPAQLFASDCTGSGCHRSPQGLAKSTGAFGLTNFLRQHYTNSQQSAAALAGYLASLPAGPQRRQPEPKSRASAPPPDAHPKSGDTKSGDTKSGDTKADDRKTTARPPRGRQATADTPAAAPAAAPPSTPAPDPEPPAAEPPPPPPAPPAPKVFDIFD